MGRGYCTKDDVVPRLPENNLNKTNLPAINDCQDKRYKHSATDEHAEDTRTRGAVFSVAKSNLAQDDHQVDK